MTVSKDNNGWTVIDPTRDTNTTLYPAWSNQFGQNYTGNGSRFIFTASVANGGNDSNLGTPASPKATVYGGLSKLRDGAPDWLCVRKGDVFADLAAIFMVTIDQYFYGNGKSASEPRVMTTWDPTAANNPPRFCPINAALGRTLLKQGMWNNTTSDGGRNYLAIGGFYFYATKRDPLHADYDPAYTTHIAPFSYNLPGHDVLLEDCAFKMYSAGIGWNGGLGANATAMTLRRCQILDSYSAGDIAVGLGTAGINSLIEENVIDHNDWHATLDPVGQSLSHNMYFNSATPDDTPTWAYFISDIVLRGNLVSNDKYGNQGRSGGDFYNNAYIIGLYATNFSGNNAAIPLNQYRYNYHFGIGGWGIDVPDGVTPEHGNEHHNLSPISFDQNIFSNGNSGVGVCEMCIGIGSAGVAPGQNGNISITNNISYRFTISPSTNYSKEENAGATPDVYPYPAAAHSNTQTGWLYDSLIDANPTLYFGRGRTPATYMDAITGTGGHTVQDYINAARANSKDNWNPRLMVESLNDYIREGFSRPMVGSAYAGGGIFLNPLPATGIVGTSFSGSVAATGGTAPYHYATTTGALPNGLTLNTTSGLVSGTPSVPGTFNFTIQATDNVGATNSRAYSIVITTAASTITLDALGNGTAGVAYSDSAAASGGTAPYTYAVISGAMPNNLTINSATGLVSGTPTVAGTFAFTLRATDNVGATGTQAYSVTIAGVAPPAFHTARLQVS